MTRSSLVAGRRRSGPCGRVMNAVESDDARGMNDEDLSAYGDAFDVAPRVPTLTGAVVAAIATAFVCAWRRFVRHSPRA